MNELKLRWKCSNCDIHLDGIFTAEEIEEFGWDSENFTCSTCTNKLNQIEIKRTPIYAEGRIFRNSGLLLQYLTGIHDKERNDLTFEDVGFTSAFRQRIVGEGISGSKGRGGYHNNKIISLTYLALRDYLQKLGVDIEELESCFKSGSVDNFKDLL